MLRKCAPPDTLMMRTTQVPLVDALALTEAVLRHVCIPTHARTHAGEDPLVTMQPYCNSINTCTSASLLPL